MVTLLDVSPLDRTKPLALYYQVAEILRGRIAAGELQPGDAIPTEEELQRLFGISRATVRQAVRELVGEGLVRLERPRGTFVSRPKLQETLPELISFSDEVRQQGLTPSSRVLATVLEPASAHVAARLGIGEGETVLRLERLRLADDRPIALMRSHLAPWTGLGVGDDYRGSLHGLLLGRGIRLVDADQLIEAATATPEQARVLDCARRGALLTVDRVTYSADGRAAEHVVAVYRADRYAYRLRLGAATAGAGYIQPAGEGGGKDPDPKGSWQAPDPKGSP